MEPVAGIVLAAGMGTRMRSEMIKVLHPLGGRPMLMYPIEALKEAGVSRIVLIVGNQAERVRNVIGDGVEYAYQTQQLGTGHAVMQAEKLLAGFDGLVLVTYGDTPLYRPQTYRSFLDAHRRSGAAATVMSARLDDPRGYGRIVRDDEGLLKTIVEQRDIASADVEAITEINTGTYCFSAADLFDALRHVNNDNDQGEYYLPDALAVLRARGARVGVYLLDDAAEALGVNDRRELARAESIVRERTLRRLMEEGVTIIDPTTTMVHPSVDVGRDSVIYPFTTLEGETYVGDRCVIGPHSRLRNARLGQGVTIEGSVALESAIGDGAHVGPFVYLAPGSHVPPGKRLLPS